MWSSSSLRWTTITMTSRVSFPASRSVARGVASSSSSSRWLSSDGRPSGGRGGPGRGGGGRGRGGGRGAGALDRFRRESRQKKPNFAKTVLEPAARGELKHHESGIPRLAARKGKSHKVHDPYPGNEAEEIVMERNKGAKLEGAESPMTGLKKGGGVRVTYAPPPKVTTKPAEEEYDSEDEYDDIEMIDPDNHPGITRDEKGFYVIHYDSDDEDDDEDDEQNRPFERRAPERRFPGDEENKTVDPEEAFFVRDWTDFSYSVPTVPDEVANRVLPLRDHGPDLDDFLEAMFEHPSKYAEVKRINEHPERLREGKPNFPKNRVQPSLEFVTSHLRFLYVTGLPHVMDDDGEPGDMENPLHRHEVVKTVCEIFGVIPEQVSPANMTSAFIGFKDKQEARKALKEGPSRKAFVKPVTIARYSGEGDLEDFASNPDAVVELANLPFGISSPKLAHVLFPANTELGSVYGPLTGEQFKMTSPTSALLRFESADHVESAIASSKVQTRLEELGTSRVRYFKARRELVHDCYSGPNKGLEVKKRGPRLIVNGDAPSQKFFASHYGVIHLRNLEPTITKKEITDVFQPFCSLLRDVTGSVEFVTCAEGLRTDRAYVGFDSQGEAEAVVKACRGLMRVGNKPATLRLVKDKLWPGAVGAPKEVRPMRTEEEILDSLNNWEQYVDPKDIEYLEENGVRREVLDSIFRTMRFHNKTFGPTDLAMTRERLNPEKETGEDYRGTVREYIETLKECMATPENPGLLYQGLFLPGEEVDLSIFEREKERQAMLRRKYEGLE